MAVNCNEQVIEDTYALYCGDCCEVTTGLANNSIGFTVFSPPFLDWYCYSNSERDMGNSKTPEDFFAHFGILIDNLFRVTKPGRNVAVHCMDIPAMKERDGYIGLKDFPGEIIRAFQARSFIYHGRITIWKDPLIEAVRTHAIGLAHQQLVKDSAICRTGLPDYVVIFRKPGENTEPITHPDGLTSYAGSVDLGNKGVRRHNIWRAYASPVWMDVRQTNTLNRKLKVKLADARDDHDEKHICPLQLDTIERCITLWSNRGDTVLTPFMGIGSEVFQAVTMGRRGVGIELKESYFRQAVKNVRRATVNAESAEDRDLISYAHEQADENGTDDEVDDAMDAMNEADDGLD